MHSRSLLQHLILLCNMDGCFLRGNVEHYKCFSRPYTRQVDEKKAGCTRDNWAWQRGLLQTSRFSKEEKEHFCDLFRRFNIVDTSCGCGPGALLGIFTCSGKYHEHGLASSFHEWKEKLNKNFHFYLFPNGRRSDLQISVLIKKVKISIK